MTRIELLAMTSRAAMIGSFLTMASPAFAQQLTSGVKPEPATTEDAGEIVVTGSLIQGTGTTTSLPVQVLTSDSLKDRGSPSPVEFVKQLTIASGTIGDANQFGAGKGQRAEGTGSINLRGLGPERTLVLFNGKRLPLISGQFVDALKMPMSAIGRVEILKDGAAATYGSDAIAGVVNFITRTDLDGFEATGGYRAIQNSNGDYRGGLAWGWTSDRTQILLTADYQHRSELRDDQRDFSVNPFGENPEGGWSGAVTPTVYRPVNAAYQFLTTAPITDVLCGSLGTVLTNPNGGVSASGFNTCRATGQGFNDLVNRQDSFQLYGQIKTDLTDDITMTLDGLYAYSRLSTISVSGFPVLSGPTVTVAPPGFPVSAATTPARGAGYFVPATNPGYMAYVAANPTAFPAGTAGVIIPLGAYRPFGIGGNPAFGGNGATTQKRRQEEIRVSLGFEGHLTDTVKWSTNATYGQYYLYRDGNDTLTGRLQLALRGLGGPNCNFQTGTPGVGGCTYLNPFSNAFPTNAVTGEVNPTYNAAVANSPELAAWLMPYFFLETTTRQLEYNAQLNGELPFISLPGGKPEWAVGFQYRRNWYKSVPSNLVNNITTPCVDSPINGNNACTPSLVSPFALGGTEAPVDVHQNSYAIFGEARLPITDRLSANLGLRFEDFGQYGGTTFNPQFRAKWQMLEFLALRGSVGSTFRAPPQVLLVSNPLVTTQSVLGAVRPVEVRGNPNLEPETAVTFNVGAIIGSGRFKATLDYYNIHMKKAITSEPLTPVVNALFPNNGTPAAGNCATLDPQFIADHFDFSGACSALNVTRVRTLRINGPDIKTSGLDFEMSYRFPGVLGGELELGLNATYIFEYKVGDLVIGNVQALTQTDLVGFLNSGNALAYPLPQFRALGYANLDTGPHNLRLSLNYIDSYTDNRAIFGANASSCTIAANPAGCGTITHGQKIEDRATLDATYRFKLSSAFEITAAVTNVFNSAPPFARTEVGYDTLTYDPLLRTFKIGFGVKF